MDSNAALQLRDNAKTHLMQIRNIESGVEYLNKVKAIETWAKAEKKDSELQNIIAEQKIRTQRILGNLIKEGQERGEIKTQATAKSSYPRELDDLGINKKQSHIYQKIADIPETTFESFIAEKKAAVDDAVNELTTAGILHFANTGKPHVSNNSGENEWYTPSEIIEAARFVMGTIDLDPASSDKANVTVKAKKYYTIDDNGLENKWYGTVWLNPPYSQPEISLFAERVVDKILSGEISQACVLVNNATETRWFQGMLIECAAICFIEGRVKYLAEDGKSKNTPLQGQAVIYFGDSVEQFNDVFSEFGKVMFGEYSAN